MENIAWMAWTPATGCFFAGVALVLAGDDLARPGAPGGRARRRPRHSRPRAATGCSCRSCSPPSSTSPGSAWSASRRSPPARRRGNRIVEPVARHRHFAGRRRGRVPHGLRPARSSRAGSTGLLASDRTDWRKAMRRKTVKVRLSTMASAIAMAALPGRYRHAPAYADEAAATTMDRQRVPAVDALQRRPDEGDAVVHQCRETVRRHGHQRRLRNHHHA